MRFQVFNGTKRLEIMCTPMLDASILRMFSLNCKGLMSIRPYQCNAVTIWYGLSLCVSYRGKRARFDATADWSGFLPLHWVLGTAMEFRKTGQMTWKTGHSSVKISNWWLKNFFPAKLCSAISFWDIRWLLSLFDLFGLQDDSFSDLKKRGAGQEILDDLKSNHFLHYVSSKGYHHSKDVSRKKAARVEISLLFPIFVWEIPASIYAKYVSLNFKHECASLTPFYVFWFEF